MACSLNSSRKKSTGSFPLMSGTTPGEKAEGEPGREEEAELSGVGREEEAELGGGGRVELKVGEVELNAGRYLSGRWIPRIGGGA